jgi:hypothetical protein
MNAALRTVVSDRNCLEESNMTKTSTSINRTIDFGVLTVKEVRDVLKSKAHCLRAGFPADHDIIQTLNEFRDHYAKRVGLPTYLSQMLGEFGKIPVGDCQLYTDSGHQIKLNLNGSHNQPIQRFLAKYFDVETLPFRVEVPHQDQTDKAEVRYL